MGVFERLENTPLALWVGESLWGYPLMLSLHVVGLAVVAGLFIMRDLRLLGGFEGISYAALADLVRIGWFGFLINALSGAALFSSQATTFVESTPFLVKIGAIVSAAVCAVYIQRRSRREAARWDERGERPPAALRAVAAVSITLWISAIAAGRLIAYL